MRRAIEEVRKEMRHGTMAMDWQERISITKLREKRLERTQEILKTHGIAAMIVARRENKRYATSTRLAIHGTHGQSFGLVFAEGEDPIIVYEEGCIWLCEKEHVTWIKPENHRPIEVVPGDATGEGHVEFVSKVLAKDIARELKKRGLAKEKIGADLNMPFVSVLRDLGINVVNGVHVMMEARAIKCEEEVWCMKQAGAIVDIAYAEIIEALRPGLRENEIAAIGYAALWKNGVEGVNGVSVRSGPNTAPNYLGRMPTDRIIQPGDIVFMDIFGARYMGYGTCYYRTFKVGTKPTQQERDWFKKCRDILYNAVDVLRAGITTADVAKKWPLASTWKISDMPLASADAIATGNAVAHGVGLDQYEYPIISRANSLQFPQPIEAGMTIAFETWYGQTDTEHGWRGGVRLENIWLVTEKGHENLYAMPDDDFIIPPHAIYIP